MQENNLFSSKLFPVLIGLVVSLSILQPEVFATNCIESSSCMPVNPLDVLNIYDVWLGAGMSIFAMAFIIGVITIAVYVRNRSLPMLAILGLYEIAVFSSIITSKYLNSQYQIAIYVVAIAVATAIVMLVLRLVKE
jgi:hypothetical protein